MRDFKKDSLKENLKRIEAAKQQRLEESRTMFGTGFVSEASEDPKIEEIRELAKRLQGNCGSFIDSVNTFLEKGADSKTLSWLSSDAQNLRDDGAALVDLIDYILSR